MAGFHTVVFDLDGTLLDSLGDIAASANRALAQMGLPTHPVERYGSLAGQGLPNLFRAGMPASAQDRLEEAVGLFRAFYAEHQRDTTRPFDGIDEVLEELSGAGVRLAVLSNKPDAATRGLVEAYFPGVLWSAVWGHRAGYEPKPDSASCYALLNELDAAPRATAFVGDTMADMLTATAVGCHAVGVSWGFRTVEELEGHGAAEVAHHPQELLPMLLGG